MTDKILKLLAFIGLVLNGLIVCGVLLAGLLMGMNFFNYPIERIILNLAIILSPALQLFLFLRGLGLARHNHERMTLFALTSMISVVVILILFLH